MIACLQALLDDAAVLTATEPAGSPAPEPVDLVELFENLTACFALVARRRRIAVHSDLPLTAATVCVEAPRLRTLLVLLTGEAVMRMAPGRLLLRVRRENEDEKHPQKAGDRLHIHLLGSLPPVHEPLSPRLAACQQLVREGGGRLRLPVATMGDGWTLTLPVGPSPALPVQTPAVLRGQVLVVEDDDTSRHLEADLLRAHGWQVRAVADGTGALALLDEMTFDLILTDLRLPDFSGIQMVRHLRARSPKPGVTSPDVPVVGMSASVDIHDRTEGMSAGMRAVIQKPVGGAAFFALLDRLAPAMAAPVPAIAPTPEPESLSSSPALVDQEALQQYQETVGAERLLHVLTTFEEQTCARITLLQTHCAAGEREAAIRLVHAMTGSAAQLGLQVFARATAAWEAALRREKTLTQPLADLSELENIWETTRCALAAYRQTVA